MAGSKPANSSAKVIRRPCSLENLQLDFVETAGSELEVGPSVNAE